MMRQTSSKFSGQAATPALKLHYVFGQFAKNISLFWESHAKVLRKNSQHMKCVPHLWLTRGFPFSSTGHIVEVREGVWVTPPPLGVLRSDGRWSKFPSVAAAQTQSPVEHVPAHTRTTPRRMWLYHHHLRQTKSDFKL